MLRMLGWLGRRAVRGGVLVAGLCWHTPHSEPLCKGGGIFSWVVGLGSHGAQLHSPLQISLNHAVETGGRKTIIR